MYTIFKTIQSHNKFTTKPLQKTCNPRSRTAVTRVNKLKAQRHNVSREWNESIGSIDKFVKENITIYIYI